MSGFDACIGFVLAHEGGYVNHPRDPGGCTNRGITIGTLAAWRRAPVTCRDVLNMTEAEARAIYRANYWNGIRGDDLPSGVDLMVFDAAVNSGRRHSVMWLQECVGATADGAIGPKTLAAVRAVSDTTRLVHRLADTRLDFLHTLPTWEVFRGGWERRVREVKVAAQQAIGGR